MGEDLNVHTLEMLSAYVDGELDAAGVTTVERALRYNPDLAEALADMRSQKAAMQAWAHSIDSRPLPSGVRALFDAARREHCDPGIVNCRSGKH